MAVRIPRPVRPFSQSRRLAPAVGGGVYGQLDHLAGRVAKGLSTTFYRGEVLRRNRSGATGKARFRLRRARPGQSWTMDRRAASEFAAGGRRGYGLVYSISVPARDFSLKAINRARDRGIQSSFSGSGTLTGPGALFDDSSPLSLGTTHLELRPRRRYKAQIVGSTRRTRDVVPFSPTDGPGGFFDFDESLYRRRGGRPVRGGGG